MKRNTIEKHYRETQQRNTTEKHQRDTLDRNTTEKQETRERNIGEKLKAFERGWKY